MEITNIKSREFTPKASTPDAYQPSTFGQIEFDVNGVHFLTSTCNRCTDNLWVGGDTIVPLIPNSVRIEVCNFMQKIWDLKEVNNIEIPKLILDCVN